MISCCRSLSSEYGTGSGQFDVLLVIAVSALSFAYYNRERLLGNISSRTYEWPMARAARPGTGMPTRTQEDQRRLSIESRCSSPVSESGTFRAHCVAICPEAMRIAEISAAGQTLRMTRSPSSEKRLHQTRSTGRLTLEGLSH